MMQIIISIDPSTNFLFEIIKNLQNKEIKFNLIEIYPNEESYIKSLEAISMFEKKSFVLFLGHGTNEKLYGGEKLPSFPKKEFVNVNQMGIFENQNLFLLSCDSSGLLKSSFKIAKLSKSIGFGNLPTSKEEIDEDKKLKNQGISENTILEFKNLIVSTISESIIYNHKNFDKLKDYLTLFIDKEINNAVLIKKDRNLADLLFKMRNEMVIF
jgi:hypothetical protein